MERPGLLAQSGSRANGIDPLDPATAVGVLARFATAAF
jgi:hypothetical protein